MQYQTITFDGDTEHWFSEILDSNDDLLLQPRTGITPENPSKSSHRQIGLYTSASTGQAKCVWNSTNHLKENARITAREFQISRDDRLLMLAKPWHVAGLSWVLMADYVGTNYKFIATKSGEDDRWYEMIQEYDPTCLLTVPAVLRSLFSYSDWFVPRIIFGGSPISHEDYKPLLGHCTSLIQGYGQTEAGGLISCYSMDMKSNISEETCYCYGHWPNEFDIDCEGTPEQPAPILLNSPTSIHEGYYDTGDQGYLSKEGMLYLVGRKDK